MKPMHFTKMSGAGNDFIIMDNFKGDVKLSAKQIGALCTNRFSIGADGLILLERYKKGYDFYMRFYNNDGREAEMCGNGGRCIARFAYLKGRAKAAMKFMAKDGEHEAIVKPNGHVRLKMIDPFDFKNEVKTRVTPGEVKGSFINTGVPHFVVEVRDTQSVDVKNLGKELRFHSAFAPKGTNVNFVEKISDDEYSIRTYERGVEDETYACGTGAVASGVAFYLKGGAKPPVTIRTRGGELKVYFKGSAGKVTDVWLEGNARLVAEGVISEEAFKF